MAALAGVGPGAEWLAAGRLGCRDALCGSMGVFSMGFWGCPVWVHGGVLYGFLGVPCVGPRGCSLWVAAEATHRAAQQLGPDVPAAGKSTFPGAEQPTSAPVPPPNPILPSLPGQQPHPSPRSSPPYPRRAKHGSPPGPGCRLPADGGVLCRGLVVLRGGVCWWAGGTLLPWVLLSQQPPPCTPSPRPWGPPVLVGFGEPRLPPRGGVESGGAARALSPPWAPWRLLPTAPAAPSPQPGKANDPALGLGRLFLAHHHDPHLLGGRDWLESTSVPPAPCPQRGDGVGHPPLPPSLTLI